MAEPTEDDAERGAAEAVDGLLQLFALELLDVNLFRAFNPTTWPGGRVFGGLVASQALRAAISTVDVPHRIHSFHAYFLRPGQPGVPAILEVERIRDGRSFTTRRVTTIQGGEAIFEMSASFHKDGEAGADYQLPRAADAPEPDEVPDRMGGFPRGTSFFQPFEMREVGPTPPSPDGTYRSTRRVWVRTAARLPDDPAIHACVLTFMSDMAVVMAARPPTGGNMWEGFTGASLDHAVWFHRPVRADEWLYYDLHSLSTNNARGLARGVFHTHDGVLGASVTQEALIRPMRPGMTPPAPRSMPPEL